MKRFTLTEEHVKLLRAMHTDWNTAEFGAPSIDPKRPYGGTPAAKQIYEILGWPHPNLESNPDFFSNDGWTRAKKIHHETETALQVVLRTGSFEPGEYEASKYGTDWRRVEPPVRAREPVLAAALARAKIAGPRSLEHWQALVMGVNEVLTRDEWSEVERRYAAWVKDILSY